MQRRTKSLSIEQNEAARAVVRRVVDDEFGGNISAAKGALGLSYSILYDIYEGKSGVGNKTLLALAKHTGHSVEQLMGLAPGGIDETEPRHMNLPGWREAKAAIQAERDVPSFIWDKAGRGRGLAPMSPVTVEWVRDLVMDLWKHMPREEQIAAENAALDKRIATQMKRAENKALREKQPANDRVPGGAKKGARKKRRDEGGGKG